MHVALLKKNFQVCDSFLQTFHQVRNLLASAYSVQNSSSNLGEALRLSRQRLGWSVQKLWNCWLSLIKNKSGVRRYLYPPHVGFFLDSWQLRDVVLTIMCNTMLRNVDQDVSNPVLRRWLPVHDCFSVADSIILTQKQAWA